MLVFLLFHAVTTEIPAPSSQYVEGIVGQPIAINPIISGTNDVDRDLIEILFSDLIDLSEAYKVSDDGQIWSVILKENLRWSDGKSLTSDDVIFTIDTIQNTSTRSSLNQMWRGVIVNRISEREVEFTLRTPYSFFLDNLKELKIIPKHIFGVIPPENFRLSNFNLEPVGSGPYKFVSFEKLNNGFITKYNLTTNEYFANHKPFIKDFKIAFYPTSIELIEAFNNGEINGFGGIDPNKTYDINLGHLIIEKIIPQYYAIFLNKNANSNLEDENVIDALNLAVNREKIIKEVFDGRAMDIYQPILPIFSGYNIKVDSENLFSIEKANEKLNKTKWELNPETGFREKISKEKSEILEFSIIVPQVPFLTQTVEIIKNDFKEVGIKLNLIILNPTDVINEVLKNRNYEMILFGNIMKSNPDIFSFWHSSQRFYPGLNLSLYENSKVDNLLESIRTNQDESLQVEDLSKLQTIISEDRPAIFLYSPIYLYIAPKSFGGFDEKVINTPSDRFENIQNWHLKTTRVFK